MGLAYCPRATWPPPPAKARGDENKMASTNNVSIRNLNNSILPLMVPPTYFNFLGSPPQK
jgi:hypothetical protein